MKKTFVFYNDRQDYTEEMSLEEKGLFLQVILNYQNGKELGNIGPIKFIRSRVKKQLDQDNLKRSEEIEKRRESGRLGGLAKNNNKQVLASASKGKQLVADNVNDTDNKNDIYKKEITPVGVPGKKKSIINKHNKQGAIEIYDKIKELCVVVDGSLDDCVVLRSKLLNYGPDPVNLLEIMINKMRDTGLNKFYSVSNPGKLAENIGTIVEKLKSEEKRKKSFIF